MSKFAASKMPATNQFRYASSVFLVPAFFLEAQQTEVSVSSHHWTFWYSPQHSCCQSISIPSNGFDYLLKLMVCILAGACLLTLRWVW